MPANARPTPRRATRSWRSSSTTSRSTSPAAIEEYVGIVLSNSVYPDSLPGRPRPRVRPRHPRAHPAGLRARAAVRAVGQGVPVRQGQGRDRRHPLPVEGAEGPLRRRRVAGRCPHPARGLRGRPRRQDPLHRADRRRQPDRPGHRSAGDRAARRRRRRPGHLQQLRPGQRRPARDPDPPRGGACRSPRSTSLPPTPARVCGTRGKSMRFNPPPGWPTAPGRVGATGRVEPGPVLARPARRAGSSGSRTTPTPPTARARQPRLRDPATPRSTSHERSCRKVRRPRRRSQTLPRRRPSTPTRQAPPDNRARPPPPRPLPPRPPPPRPPVAPPPCWPGSPSSRPPWRPPTPGTATSSSSTTSGSCRTSASTATTTRSRTPPPTRTGSRALERRHRRRS